MEDRCVVNAIVLKHADQKLSNDISNVGKDSLKLKKKTRQFRAEKVNCIDFISQITTLDPLCTRLVDWNHPRRRHRPRHLPLLHQ